MSYSFPESSSGYRIDVNNKAAAYCPTLEAALATLSVAAGELNIHLNDDVDIVFWLNDRNGHTEKVYYAVCGWSLGDLPGLCYPMRYFTPEWAKQVH